MFSILCFVLKLNQIKEKTNKLVDGYDISVSDIKTE